MDITPLYSDYASAIFKSIYSIVKNRSDAEDISQDAWVKICTKYDTYDSSRPFLNWAISIGNNLAKDFLRKQKQQSSRFYEYAEHVYSSVESEEKVSLIDMTRDEIYGKYRIVCSLRYGAHLQLKEIAIVTGLPPPTVQWMLIRSKKQIMEAVDEAQRIARDLS